MIVSIIIPNRNNVALLGITLRSLYEDIYDLKEESEVIIADNSDEKIANHIQDKLITTKFGYKFLWYNVPGLFRSFDDAAKKARGKYIIRLDSDMIVGKNMISDMVKFIKTHNNIGFAHAPVNFFTQTQFAAQHQVSLEPGPAMCRWAGLSKKEETITYKGMPWICDRKWYNKTLKGYGALSEHNLTPFGDPYIGIKSWILGYPNWAIPCRAGIHMGRMESSKPFDNFKTNGNVGNYNSFMTACVTAFVLTNEPKKWAPIFIRVGKSDKEIETATFQYYEANEKLIEQIGTRDKKEIQAYQKYQFEDLIKLKPWNQKKTLYERVFPEWKKIAGKRSNSCIKQEDWSLLRSVIGKYKIKSVLEFGSGLSTMLFSQIGLRVTSYETDSEFMNLVKDLCCHKIVNFRLWDNNENVKLTPADQPELGLVDGIRPRFRQAEECVKNHCKFIAVHDVGASSKGVPEKVLSDWRPMKNRTKRLVIYEKCDRIQSPVVSVIISHRGDFAMLGITVRSVLEDCINLPDFVEIVICDNSNEKENIDYVIAPQFIKEGKVKLIYQNFPCLFTAREKAIECAKGKYIICLDSHVLIGRNMISDMVNYIKKAPDKIGFVHAPLVYVSQNENAQRHEFQTRKYYKTPSKMDGIKGMPWICKKTWWHEMGGYGTLAKEKVSWGGGDVYLALKSMALGYENWAIPCRPALHIGPYTKLDRKYYKYRNWGVSGVTKPWFGLLLTSYILGEDEFPNKITNLREYHMKNFSQEDWQQAKKMGHQERVKLKNT